MFFRYCFLLLHDQALKKAANWPGAGAVTREKLLKRVQTYLPAHVLLPPGRLNRLLEQAKMFQITETDKQASTSGVTVQELSGISKARNFSISRLNYQR